MRSQLGPSQPDVRPQLTMAPAGSSTRATAARAPGPAVLSSEGDASGQDSGSEVQQLLTPRLTQKSAGRLSERHAGGDEGHDREEALDGEETGTNSQGEDAALSREPSQSAADEAADRAVDSRSPNRHGGSVQYSTRAKTARTVQDWPDDQPDGTLAAVDGPDATAAARRAPSPPDEDADNKDEDQPDSDESGEDLRDRLRHAPAGVLFLRWNRSKRPAAFWLAPAKWWRGLDNQADLPKRQRPAPELMSREHALAAIEEYGSTLVKQDDFHRADFAVIPPGRRDEEIFRRAARHDVAVVTSQYIAEAAQVARKAADDGEAVLQLRDYREFVLKPVPVKRIPRAEYTPAEDLAFAKMIRKRGRGIDTFRAMAKKYPQHSEQSWNNHLRVLGSELNALVKALARAESNRRKTASPAFEDDEDTDELPVAGEEPDIELGMTMSLKRSRSASRRSLGAPGHREGSDSDEDDSEGY